MQDNAYIQDLARNPLMLSAICPVNYFEGGQLPNDRVLLYRPCVEGLLHRWDQRRGIHSLFTLEEKHLVCREVVIAMQADDSAEASDTNVKSIFADTLGDEKRAASLLEHIRYRTGLLIERRKGVFAFAHLTFQEYLAAFAIVEGNQREITAEQLIEEHKLGQWREVIPLFCGIAPSQTATNLLQSLRKKPGCGELAEILANGYLTSNSGRNREDLQTAEIVNTIAKMPLNGHTFITNPLSLFDSSIVQEIYLNILTQEKAHDIDVILNYIGTNNIVLETSMSLDILKYRNVNEKSRSLLLVYIYNTYDDLILDFIQNHWNEIDLFNIDVSNKTISPHCHACIFVILMTYEFRKNICMRLRFLCNINKREIFINYHGLKIFYWRMMAFITIEDEMNVVLLDKICELFFWVKKTDENVELVPTELTPPSSFQNALELRFEQAKNIGRDPGWAPGDTEAVEEAKAWLSDGTHGQETPT